VETESSADRLILAGRTMSQIQEVTQAFRGYYERTQDSAALSIIEKAEDLALHIQAFGTQNPEILGIAGVTFRQFYSERLRRNDKGQYAEELGMSTNQLFNIAKGYSRPSHEMRKKLIRVANDLFGVRVYFPDDE